tara:strand:+ start:1062 stop:2237 length:1176 start_codon:yes stop_codon:yes gene_type:complete
LNNHLININDSLASKGSKLRIEQRGCKLNIRGPLPCKTFPGEVKTQRISLGLPTNAEGLKQATKLLELINLQLEHKQFNWQNWSEKATQSSNPKPITAIEEAVDLFKINFFEDTTRSKLKASKLSNWTSAYKPYLRRVIEKAKNENLNLNKSLLVKVLLSYSENSRSRQQCGTALKAFAKYLSIDLPEDWKKIACGYGLHLAKYRQLPSDNLIIETSKLIPNPKWKLVYGLIAAYGLRNHEAFFCDLSCLKKDKDRILRVFHNTKTGEHQVWPFHPSWVDLFELDKLGEDISLLPNICNDLSKTTLQQVGRRVSEQFRRYKLPITPYNLRHAWAIRTIHVGLPDTVSARMMGHSVSIHTRTYHHWITRRDQQKAVDQALSKNSFDKEKQKR